MVQNVEAVYEDGVLKPLAPLSLKDHQRVNLTITDRVAPVPYNDRRAEIEWLRQNRDQYSGQWVALNGNKLISHGADARAVFDKAHECGVTDPLMVRIPLAPELPSAGWL